MLIRGKDIQLYVKIDSIFQPIACDKSCTLDIQADFLRKTDPANAKSVARVPVETDWRISGNGLIDYNSTASGLFIQNAVLTAQRIFARFSADKDDGHCYYSGYGYFSKVSETGNVEGMASFSYEIVADGALTISNTIPQS